MRAFIFEKYGNPEKVLSIKNVDIPKPKQNEVLVKVFATAVNDYDWSLITGRPYLYRLMYGIIKPKIKIAGMEFSGIVKEVGSGVNNIKIGDAVLGDTSNFGLGTFAEYICINEKSLIKKPENMSFEEAASVPHAFCLALQALKDLGNIENAQKLLINGAGGGVGTFGLQIAKLYDCEVTGVDSKNKLDMMKSIGFDHVIDYEKINFTKNGKEYDLILDCKSNRTAFSYLRSLKQNGRYITIGGKISSLLGIFILGKVITRFSKKITKVLMLKPNKGVNKFIELFNQNKITTQIDGPYSFNEIPRLIKYFGEAKHIGKVIVKII